MRYYQCVKLVSEIRQQGVRPAISKVVHHIRFLAHGRALRKDPVYDRRVELFADLSARLNSTVKYGPFRGMRLPKETAWAGPDRAPMLFGLYEQEVMKVLADHRSKSATFIDVGAADGYYGVGVLLAAWFNKAYCYEMSELGQAVIRSNAAENGVSNNLVVRGAANPGFYKDIPSQELEGAVILVDIEGGEFELIDSAALAALQSAAIIIEVHPWVHEGEIKLRSLLERAKRTHRVSNFQMGARNPGEFEELKEYSDTDRWLICSEDRPALMSWLLLEPK